MYYCRHEPLARRPDPSGLAVRDGHTQQQPDGLARAPPPPASVHHTHVSRECAYSVMPLPPAVVRVGLGELRALAIVKARQDIVNRCDQVAAMSDIVLQARQHEIESLRILGLSPIEAGYIEDVVKLPDGS